jgi:predicted component of type VI protein secretion system
MVVENLDEVIQDGTFVIKLTAVMYVDFMHFTMVETKMPLQRGRHVTVG